MADTTLTAGGRVFHSYLETLSGKLTADGIENVFGIIDGDSPVLRATPDNLGSQSNGGIMMELCFVSIGEDDVMLQVYSTLADRIPKEFNSEILSFLNNLNLTALVGAFGVYEQGGQVFHRYNIITTKNGSVDLDKVYSDIEWVYTAIDTVYDEIKSKLTEIGALK